MMRSISEDYKRILNSKYYLNCFKYQNDFFHSTSFNLNQSYYDVLNVSKNASQKEIKTSYLKLCKLYHPDTSESNLSKEEKVKRFQKINEAYSCLGNLYFLISNIFLIFSYYKKLNYTGKPETKDAYDQSYSNPNYYQTYNNPYKGRSRPYPRR